MVMHAKPAMKVRGRYRVWRGGMWLVQMRRELENTLLGKISSGDYLKESWYVEGGGM